MRKTKRVALILLLLVLAAVGYGAYVFVLAGELKSIEPHFAGNCRIVEGVAGPEDIIILPDGRTALISSDDLRAAFAGQPRPGAILAYDPAGAQATLVNLTPDAADSFHPHGIGLHVAPDGAMRLFVVNHPVASLGDEPGERRLPTIEVFDFVGGRLAHQRTISNERLVSPNDVVPVGPDRFYVTNDHGAGSGFMRKLEDYIMLERANVLYYDGTRFTVVVKVFLYANGINISRDGSQVYLFLLLLGHRRLGDFRPNLLLPVGIQALSCTGGGQNIARTRTRSPLAHPSVPQVHRGWLAGGFPGPWDDAPYSIQERRRLGASSHPARRSYLRRYHPLWDAPRQVQHPRISTLAAVGSRPRFDDARLRLFARSGLSPTISLTVFSSMC